MQRTGRLRGQEEKRKSSFLFVQQFHCCRYLWFAAPGGSLTTPPLKGRQAARAGGRANSNLSWRLPQLSCQHPHENSLRHRMAQQTGGENSPKKERSLNLVTGFYHYLRGKCTLELFFLLWARWGEEKKACLIWRWMEGWLFFGWKHGNICRLTESLYVCLQQVKHSLAHLVCICWTGR